jgi:hypothetical protein
VRAAMVGNLNVPVLNVAADVMQQLDGDDALTGLWTCEYESIPGT